MKTLLKHIAGFINSKKPGSQPGNVVVIPLTGGSQEHLEKLHNRLIHLQIEERALREQGKRTASVVMNGHGLDMVHIYGQALSSNQVEQVKIMSLLAHYHEQEQDLSQA